MYVFFGIVLFIWYILVFYSRKRMALLPSPSKGPPDSPPLSSTTTVGKMYVNVLFFGIVFFYLIYFCSFTARRGWCCFHHPRKARLTVRRCRQQQRRVKCMFLTFFYLIFSSLFVIFLYSRAGAATTCHFHRPKTVIALRLPHPNKY